MQFFDLAVHYLLIHITMFLLKELFAAARRQQVYLRVLAKAYARFEPYRTVSALQVPLRSAPLDAGAGEVQALLSLEYAHLQAVLNQTSVENMRAQILEGDFACDMDTSRRLAREITSFLFSVHELENLYEVSLLNDLNHVWASVEMPGLKEFCAAQDAKSRMMAAWMQRVDGKVTK